MSAREIGESIFHVAVAAFYSDLPSGFNIFGKNDE
jgi:hypothetical protein